MAAHLNSLVGAEIDGRFTITHKIGQGGMGAVYAAVQESIGREVAIKVIHPPLASDNATARRFLREAWLASRLQSPHVVRVLDFGQTDDGQLYMAMEMAPGHTVSTELRRARRFEPVRTVQIGMQICAALEAAHEQGVVHRDLKPANIMLCRRNGADHVTVLDFGLAKSLHNENGNGITEAGIIVGTSGYVPPELIRGEPAAPTSDLYSLGAVLYTMLAGRKPFVGDELTVLRAHVLHAPAPLPPSVPAALAEVIYRLLAKAPERRYPSARAAREALAMALSTPATCAPSASALGETDTLELALDDLSIEVIEHDVVATSSARPRGRSWGLALAFLLLVVATIATVGLSHAEADATPVTIDYASSTR